MAKIFRVLVLAALAVSVRAGEPAADVAARAGERGIPPEPLVAPVLEAERLGLPARPVADKVLEGIAKGVPAERVAAVAGSLVARLREADRVMEAIRARGLAPPVDREGALVDLAQALSSGVEPPAVLSLAAVAARTGGKAADVVAASAALGALARRGVPVAGAMALGRALVASPRRAPEIGPAFDAWRDHGGRDVEGFLSEAERRVGSGRSLADVEREGGVRGLREAGGEGRGGPAGEGRRGRHP